MKKCLALRLLYNQYLQIKMSLKKITTRAPLCFALFLLATIPLNIRKIFNFDEIKNIEGFRENISWSLFPFDIMLLLLFLSLAFLLVFRPKDSLTKDVKFAIILKNPLFLLVSWLIFSILLATNTQIAIYVTSRLLLAILAFVLLQKALDYKRRTFIYATSCLLVSGVLQALLGISQFVSQKSIGLKFLGESELSDTILGVAKFELAGTKIIRAYGTFPHPNLFAVYLLLTLAAGIWLVLYVNFPKKSKILNIVLPSSLAIIVTGIVLSYSRSVIIGFVFFTLALLFAHKERFLGLFKQACRHFHIPKIMQGAFGLLLAFSLLFASYNVLSPRICFNHCENDNSIDLRLEYMKTAAAIIASSPLTGVGMGNFTVCQKDHFTKNIKPWEQQPVHNIYLLIASEIGLIGLAFFLYSIVYLAHIFKKGFFGRLHNPFILCFFIFLLLGFADHYFWTLPQGMLIFWVCLAFFHSSAKITNIK